MSEMNTLADVKDKKMLIPATNKVKMKIKKIDVRSKDKAGMESNWKTLNVQLQVVDGVDVDGVIKYKNTTVFGTVVYNINPDTINSKGNAHGTQDYYKRRWSDLKGLVLAIGDDLNAVSLDDESIATYVQELSTAAVGKEVTANITISKGTGGYDDKNEVKYFKAVKVEDTI